MVELTAESVFRQAIANSLQTETTPFYIYKHSTRCPVSRWAWQDIKEQVPHLPEGTFLFLDVIANRALSNLVANELQVQHESPQLLKILAGRCAEHVSHERVNTKFFD